MLWRPLLCVLLAVSACAPLYAPEAILHASRGDGGPDDLSDTTGGTDTTQSVTAGDGGTGTASSTASASTTGGATTTSTTGGTTTSTTAGTTTTTTVGTTTTTTTSTTTTTGGAASCKDFGAFSNHPVQGGATAQLDLAVDNANAFVAWSETAPAINGVFVVRGDRTGSFSGVGSANSAPGVSSVTTNNVYPAIALDGNNRPTVAWAGLTTTSGDGVFAMRLDGANTWRAMGTSNNAAVGIGPALQAHAALLVVATAVSPSGVPYVAWVSTSDQSLYVRRYMNSSWQAMTSGVLATTNVSNTGQLAIIAPSDTAVSVAWLAINTNGNPALKLEQWDGSNWVALGESLSDSGISANASGTTVDALSLAAQPSGLPAVAWSDNRFNADNVYYAQWNNGTWQQLNNSKLGTGISGQVLHDAQRPGLALDPNGYPVIAWQQAPNSGSVDQIFMRRWDGSNWVSSGSSSTGSGVSVGTTNTNVWPRVKVTPGNVPVIAWQEVNGDGSGVVHVCGWR